MTRFIGDAQVAPTRRPVPADELAARPGMALLVRKLRGHAPLDCEIERAREASEQQAAKRDAA